MSTTLIVLIAYIVVALIASAMFTVYFAKNPFEPDHNQVGWKPATFVWSILWPFAIIVFIWCVCDDNFKSPWTWLYERVQKND